MPEGGISHRGAQMSRQGKRVTTIGINYWINQLSEKLFKNTDIFMFICVCVYWYSVILFFSFLILLLCFMPLLRTCCVRALERDGYLVTWPLLSLIMRAVFSLVFVFVRVRAACCCCCRCCRCCCCSCCLLSYAIRGLLCRCCGRSSGSSSAA